MTRRILDKELVSHRARMGHVLSNTQGNQIIFDVAVWLAGLAAPKKALPLELSETENGLCGPSHLDSGGATVTRRASRH